MLKAVKMLLNVFDLLDHHQTLMTLYFIGEMYIIKIYKQVKLSDKKEQRLGDIVTPFLRSNAKRC